MKNRILITLSALIVFTSCSDSGAPSESIEGYWNLDSVVFYNKSQHTAHDIKWFLHVKEDNFSTCMQGNEQWTDYTLIDMKEGKGKLSVSLPNKEKKVSAIEITDEDHFIIIQGSLKGEHSIWYHTRITEENYTSRCNLKQTE